MLDYALGDWLLNVKLDPGWRADLFGRRNRQKRPLSRDPLTNYCRRAIRVVAILLLLMLAEITYFRVAWDTSLHSPLF